MSISEKLIVANTLDFDVLVSDLVEKGVPEERALRSVAQYREFFAACAAYPDKPLVPTHLCDLAWHAHMLRPAKYARDCIALAGHIMDHDPGVYRTGPFQDAYDLTRNLVPYGHLMPLDAYAANDEMAGAECFRAPSQPSDPEDPFVAKAA
ncbi:glycine-rich domain-containing protein-like [Azospirillum sp. B506]|uniref:glycine-rich domain-containing protein-like n=1 Tax=Azospirillum sp. B506 TaxID=137721 RepID=UPI00067928E0|nr:glycine-rich domain-containing protein-like [Azospirillum sp. B506]